MADNRFSLRSWQRHFERIYAQQNEERFGRGPYGKLDAMWLRLLEHASNVAKGIRRNQIRLTLNEISHVFAWYCGFCTKAKIDLEWLIWHFFPHVCPTCWSATCTCGLIKRKARWKQKNEPRLLYLEKRNYSHRPRSLDGYVKMFASIYGNHSESSTLGNAYLHFSEETGEVAGLIRKIQSRLKEKKPIPNGSIRKLHSELADVFSWLCKMVWKIELNYRGYQQWIYKTSPKTGSSQKPFQLNFSLVILRSYRDGCPFCHSPECRENCPGLNR